MAAMTHLNQDHVVTGYGAHRACWSVIDGGSRSSEKTLVGSIPVTATNATKPFHGYARRPSEGSS
ncbi:MAG: hypothetical protein KDB02_08375 [Acidimicrobiales bacterium]|nr:hypothetical protein [Acidimicrobiales bacterium]